MVTRADSWELVANLEYIRDYLWQYVVFAATLGIIPEPVSELMDTIFGYFWLNLPNLSYTLRPPLVNSWNLRSNSPTICHSLHACHELLRHVMLTRTNAWQQSDTSGHNSAMDPLRILKSRPLLGQIYSIFQTSSLSQAYPEPHTSMTLPWLSRVDTVCSRVSTRTPITVHECRVATIRWPNLVCVKGAVM